MFDEISIAGSLVTIATAAWKSPQAWGLAAGFFGVPVFAIIAGYKAFHGSMRDLREQLAAMQRQMAQSEKVNSDILREFIKRADASEHDRSREQITVSELMQVVQLNTARMTQLVEKLDVFITDMRQNKRMN